MREKKFPDTRTIAVRIELEKHGNSDFPSLMNLERATVDTVCLVPENNFAVGRGRKSFFNEAFGRNLLAISRSCEVLGFRCSTQPGIISLRKRTS